jgi:hypothetical protein
LVYDLTAKSTILLQKFFAFNWRLRGQRAVPARGCVNGNAEARRASADHEKIPGFSGVLNLVQDSVSFHGRSFLRSIVINAGLGTPVALHHLTRMVEQHDFAKGTSSRSTKLVHGGVRYLKQANISLVLEALRERGLLCENAPHLVHHLEFIVPIYSWWEGPFYGIGMKIYDRLAGKLGLKVAWILANVPGVVS